jgi:hypothetical protein
MTSDGIDLKQHCDQGVAGGSRLISESLPCANRRERKAGIADSSLVPE